MTLEEKDLLLKDLCARLPYGIKVNCNDKVYNFAGIHSFNICVLSDDNENNAFTTAGLKYIKPYLFPLSSMTDEQEKELEELDPEFYTIINDNGTIECVMNNKTFDWFHKHHFDWRGLIPKGLAKDATGLNIY